MEPSDVDKFMQTVSHALTMGILRVAEILYRWQRHLQAPYYLPPPREEEAQPKEEPYHEV